MKNALVIYFSKFGHTRAIAGTIGDWLGGNAEVRVLSAEQLCPDDFEGVGLVVMGAPTHKMNLPKEVRPILAALPKRCLRGVRFAAFDTSYKLSRWLNPYTAGNRLDARLRKLGGVRLASPMTFHVEAREGPLYPGEMARAREWAEGLVTSMT